MRPRWMSVPVRGTHRGRTPARFALACVACLLAWLLLTPAASAAPPPSGFTVEPVVSGLDTPTGISFADDGRMFIAEKRGVIRVVKNGALLPTPFIDISADVNNFFEHGLVGIALHPDFPTVPYVYALYTYDPPGVPQDQFGSRVARLERITANPLNTDVAATGPAARTVLLGRNGDASAIQDPNAAPSLTCRQNQTRVEDCIPQDSRRHNIGTVTFGPDGALYAGNGDSDRLPNGPQDPANHIGAIMRIDPITGSGLPDNPFYNGNPASNISKTWAYGLRNPFRFSLDPVSGQMFIGDVGEHTWESMHLGQSGKNYGWPCYEGGNRVYGTFQNSSTCQPVYAGGPRPPLYQYGHTAEGGAITAGDWYHGTTYPAAYRNAHFFADYSQGWVKYMKPNGTGGYTVTDFLDDGGPGGLASGIVQIVAGPDTDLYWVSINNGAVYRLRYGSGPPSSPPHVLSLPFEEGAGTVAADSTGNGNNADLLNGADWSPGRLGGGLDLDGVNDVAAIDNSPSLNGIGDELTVAGWTRRGTAQAGWRNLISRQLGTTGADQLFLAFKDGTPNFGVNTAGKGLTKVGSGSAGVNQWVHLAGVYDGTEMTLYVNGVERASTAKTGNLASSTRPLLVGANANGTDPLAVSENLAGGVDEIELFSRALSPSEVAALANPAVPPEVTITEPADETVVQVGTTVDFAGTADDEVDGDLTDEIEWSAALHHNVHTHPDYLPPTTGPGGSFVFDDHDDDIYVELCAEVTNSAGRTGKDCVDVRPRTTTVTMNSVPQGRDVSFGNRTGSGPFTTVANVGATRTLSAPLSSGCFEFDHWSDGGGATHDIVVPATNPTYTATFRDTCAQLLSLDFDEGAGTVAADGSGNGNDADLLGGAGWAAGGHTGSALKLDGLNDFAAVDDSPSLNGVTDEFTIAGWTRRPKTQTGWRDAVSRQLGTTADQQLLLAFKDGTPKFGISTAADGVKRIGKGSAPLSQWVHLAGVYDGTEMTLYVNGVERASTAKTGNLASSSRPLLVGAGANGSDPLAATENLIGRVDQVALDSRALSAAEVANLAAESSSRAGHG